MNNSSHVVTIPEPPVVYTEDIISESGAHLMHSYEKELWSFNRMFTKRWKALDEGTEETDAQFMFRVGRYMAHICGQWGGHDEGLWSHVEQTCRAIARARGFDLDAQKT